MKSLPIVALAFSLLLVGCRENSHTFTIEEEGFAPPSLLVEAYLSGTVTDPTGQPLNGVTVRVGNEMVQTNMEGLFQFGLIRMDAAGTAITFTKNGYLTQFDRIYPNNNGHYFSEKVLLEDTPAGTINGISGGALAVGQATIQLPQSAARYESGIAYDGEIQVNARWIAPDAPDLGPIMPGALLGRRADGSLTTLTAYGMLSTELSSTGGEPLFLANGKSATLLFPIPNIAQSALPPSIPLWHFNEAEGLWEEEGEAILEGSEYIAEVSHFSIWALFFPNGTPAAELSGCIAYDSDGPAAFHTFRVLNETGQLLVYGKTNAQGRFNGPFPTDTPASIRVLLPCGGEELFSIGPIDDDTQLSECLNITSQDPITVSGLLSDCENAPLPYAAVRLDINGSQQYVSTDSTGAFIFYATCTPGSLATVIGFDAPNAQATSPTEIILADDLDIGTLTTCDAPEEFLTINADIEEGVTMTFVFLSLYDNNPTGTPYDIGCEGTDSEGRIHFLSVGFPSLQPGIYTDDEIMLIYEYFPEGSINSGRISLSCFLDCTNLTVELTHNGGPDGFLEGEFSGSIGGTNEVNGTTLEDITVSGNFRVAQ
jgi:hypothetical protein